MRPPMVSTRDMPNDEPDALRLLLPPAKSSAAAAATVAAEPDDRKLIAAQITSRWRDLDAIMDRRRVGQAEAAASRSPSPWCSG